MNSSFLTKVQFSAEQINSLINGAGKNELLLMSHTISQNHSRWIPEINVKPKTIKAGENLCDLELDNDLLAKTLKA